MTIHDTDGNVDSKSKSEGIKRKSPNFLELDPILILLQFQVMEILEEAYRRGGTMATPGTYSASLHLEKNGIVSPLDGPDHF